MTQPPWRPPEFWEVAPEEGDEEPWQDDWQPPYQPPSEWHLLKEWLDENPDDEDT